MIFECALFILLAMATTTIETLPAWLAPASKNYQTCLFNAIDRQYRTGRFSEKAVLSRCTVVRRVQMRAAELALADATGDKNGKAMVRREFTRLDKSVWTIVGHIRARRSAQQGGS